MRSPAELKAMHGDGYVKSFHGGSRARLARLLPYIRLNSTDSVADFACGSGWLMELIAPQVRSYIGVDFSESFIASANENRLRMAAENVSFVRSEIVAFCEQHEQKFDVGFAMDFAEHVYDDEWGRILRAIRKSLKPCGKLYLHTPNADFFLEKMKSRNVLLRQIPVHIAVRNLEQNVCLLQAAGYSIGRVCYLSHYNVLKPIHLLASLPWVGRYFRARIFIEASRDG